MRRASQSFYKYSAAAVSAVLICFIALVCSVSYLSKLQAQVISRFDAPQFFASTSDPGDCRPGDFYIRTDSWKLNWCGSDRTTHELPQIDVSSIVTTSAEHVQFAETLLTAAQVKALVATPVQLVAAQGSEKIIQPISVAITYHGLGATPYTITGAGNLVLHWGTHDFGGNAPSMDKTILTEADDEVGFFNVATVHNKYDTHDNTENLALMLTQDGMSEYADGDATVQIEVQYVVINVH